MATVARKLGFETLTLDSDPKTSPDVLVDILEWDFRDKRYYFDFVHASVPCEEWSMCKTRGERNLSLARQIAGRTRAIIEHFLARWSSLHGQDAPSVSSDVFDWLMRYEWPGNVRVLEHAVSSTAQWAVLDSGIIELEHLPPRLLEGAPAGQQDAVGSMGLRQLTEAYQCRVIESALKACDGQITKAADMLDVDRSNLRVTMRRLGISWGKD